MEAINKNKDNNIDTLIISIAGPKLNNSITMTNRNYTFNSDRIKSKFNLQKCIILNDWEAIAHSFNFISKDIKYNIISKIGINNGIFSVNDILIL